MLNIIQNLIKIINFDIKNKQYFYLLVVLVFVGALLEVFGIALIIPLVSIILTDNINETFPFLTSFFLYFNQPSKNELLFYFSLLFILFFVIKNVYLIYLSFLKSVASVNLEKNLSSKLFEFYLDRNFYNNINISSSILIRNLVGETNSVATAYINFINLTSDLLLFLILSILLIYASPTGALLSILILSSSGYLIFKLTSKKINNLSYSAQKYEGVRLRYAREILNNRVDILIYSKKKYFYKIFFENLINLLNIQKIVAILVSFPRLLFELVGIICILLLIYSLIIFNATPEEIIITLSLFASAAFKILPSINRITTFSQKINLASANITNIYSEIKNYYISKNKFVNHDIILFQKNISFENISFFYNSSNKILNSYNYVFQSGKCYGLYGKSGSGKSTFFKLLMNLIEPNSGIILVDGINISNQSKWKENFSYISQTTFFLEDTIEKNIAFGTPEKDIDNDLMIDVVEKSGLKEFVDGLQFGIKTKLIENAENLSGGQKQRIAIARALYKKPKILIMDEPTSSVDVKNKKLILDTINSLKKKQTIFISSHIKEDLYICDEIIYFK